MINARSETVATNNTLLTSQAVTDLVFHPVDIQVNSVRCIDSSNIKPIQMEFDFTALDT